MESFVSTKSEATEELREGLSKLKAVYGSGIGSLDNIAVKVFKGFASETDMLLQDLQKVALTNRQEEKLIAFSQ